MSYVRGLTPGTFDTVAFRAIKGHEEYVQHPFELSEYHSRLNRVREQMRKMNIDLLYITTPEAICYLHGYYTSWYKANSPMRYPQLYGTAVHVDHDRCIHFDNPTEASQLLMTSVSTDNRFFSSREGRPTLEFIMNELRREGWLKGTVGLEFWSYVPNRAVSMMMERAFRDNGCEVVDGSTIMREVRRVKSPQEIKYIEEAVGIADIGHRTIIEKLKPGMTELELFGEVVSAMMAAGGEFPALIPIFSTAPVVNGVPLAGGHSMATRKRIRDGEVLCADLCGVVNRYHGNVLRGFYVGGNPPARMVDQYKRASGVYEVIRKKTKAGMTVAEVNHTVRKYYEDVGLWEQDGWALGYELGLSLPPDWVGEFYFNLRDTDYLDRVFDEGMVTNFESMFNTTLIDTIVWEKNGARTLSKMPEELIVIG